MSTLTVAKRLIELCKDGKFLQAQHELYDDKIISIETDGSRTAGAAYMNLKEKRFLSSVERFQNIEFSEPLIAGNYFTVVLKMELETKNSGYVFMEEICVYKVEGEKIIFEQFFRD